MKIMLKILGFFAKNLFPKEEKEKISSKVPKFLLPETAEKFSKEALIFKEGLEREFSSAQEEFSKIIEESKKESKNNHLPDNSINSSAYELKRREWGQRYLDVEKKLRTLRDDWGYNLGLSEIEERLRREELCTIMVQGITIHQIVSDDGCDWKKERRVVKYGGSFFLLHLEYRMKFRKTGKQFWVEPTGGHAGHTPSPGHFRDEMVPTGEYHPPVPKWGTDSFCQFRDEELLVCK